MSEIKDLHRDEAIKKMKSLAESINICMFCTHIDEMPFQTRPMGTMEVDEEGNFWFFSKLGSEKNNEIRQDDEVQLLYAKPSSSEFMSVYGHADVFRDRSKVEELWTPIAKAWFTEGKNDPTLTVIRVRPKEARYWETKENKMVYLLRMVGAIVTGSTPEGGGVEGTLKP